MPCEIFWIIHLYVFYFLYDVIRCIRTTKNITMIFLNSMGYVEVVHVLGPILLTWM